MFQFINPNFGRIAHMRFCSSMEERGSTEPEVAGSTPARIVHCIKRHLTLLPLFGLHRQALSPLEPVERQGGLLAPTYPHPTYPHIDMQTRMPHACVRSHVCRLLVVGDGLGVCGADRDVSISSGDGEQVGTMCVSVNSNRVLR